MNKATISSYFLWVGLAIGYPLLQAWGATSLGWIGTPERELLFSTLTRLPLLVLLLVTYRPAAPAAGWRGNFGGAVAIALGLGLVLLIGSKQATFAAAGMGTVVYFVLAMLAIAATEEYLFRGQLLLAQWRPGTPARWLWLIATLAFAGTHAVNGLIYAGSSWSGIVSQMIYALLVGGLLGWLALRLRRIWPLVLLHAGLNIGLATGRLREPVFAPEAQLPSAAILVMVLALGVALWGARNELTKRTPS